MNQQQNPKYIFDQTQHLKELMFRDMGLDYAVVDVCQALTGSRV